MAMLLRFLAVLPVLALACGKPAVELREISHFDTAGWAHDISLEGNYIFVADRQGGFLQFDGSQGYRDPRICTPVKDVISLSPNSGSPVLAARFEGLVLVSASGKPGGSYSNGDIANAVEVRGNLAFAAYGLQGLITMRLSDGRMEKISALPTQGWSHDLRLSRDQAFIADWNGLKIVDIRNPAKPVQTGFLPSAGRCISLAVRETNGMRMVALAEGQAGVAVARVDDGGRPSLIGRNLLGLNPGDPDHPKSGGWVHSVAWAGDYIFAANWKRGLTLLDASDLKNLKVILQVPTSGTSLGVKTKPQPDGAWLVFLADGESGLRIFRFAA